jgi:two-component system CitB family sensor kinase
VLLTVGSDSLVRGVVALPEDVATVLANLIDNAVSAAVYGQQPRWVEVELLDDGDTLVMSVSDSGQGVPDGEQVFGDRQRIDLDPDAVHGRGIGLPLVRDIAARLGGEVWLADAGGSEGSGAVFCARLPGVMQPPTHRARGEDG